MKKQLKRVTVLLLATSICMTKTFGQASIQEITDKFFSIYSKEPAKAIDYAFSTNTWTERKQDQITDLKNKLKNVIDLCGEYHGYELLTEKSAGTNIRTMTYYILYDREPMRFTFLFYKPNGNWRVNNFSFDGDISRDMK